MRIAQGSYAGNGSDNREITGVGFQPMFLLVKGGANIAAARTSSMSGDLAHPMTGPGGTTDTIQQVTADGFVLGTHARANANGTTYHWLAIAGDTDADFSIVQYTGDGTSSRPITGAGFAPSMVIIVPADQTGGTRVYWKTTAMAATAAQQMDGALATNLITALGSDGFTVDGNANSNGKPYHAACFKHALDRFRTVTWTGNGSDDRGITGVGFEPQFALVKGDNTAAAALRFRGETGDNSFLADATGEGADRIQAFQADGFQVGTVASVNADTVLYYAAAFAIAPSTLRARVVLSANQSVATLPANQARLVIPSGHTPAVLR